MEVVFGGPRSVRSKRDSFSIGTAFASPGQPTGETLPADSEATGRRSQSKRDAGFEPKDGEDGSDGTASEGAWPSRQRAARLDAEHLRKLGSPASV